MDDFDLAQVGRRCEWGLVSLKHLGGLGRTRRGGGDGIKMKMRGPDEGVRASGKHRNSALKAARQMLRRSYGLDCSSL